MLMPFNTEVQVHASQHEENKTDDCSGSRLEIDIAVYTERNDKNAQGYRCLCAVKLSLPGTFCPELKHLKVNEQDEGGD